MFKDVAPKSTAGTTGKARKLRRVMTLLEVLIWRLLRARPHGLKFRRQHPSGQFVLDFYCSDARLAIEIDGAAHGLGDRPMRDAARDDWLAAGGIATLRIPASEVLTDAETACRTIVAACLARLPLHHPAAPGGPPPRAKLGED